MTPEERAAAVRRQRAAIKARLHRPVGHRLKPQRPHRTLCFHNGCPRWHKEFLENALYPHTETAVMETERTVSASGEVMARKSAKRLKAAIEAIVARERALKPWELEYSVNSRLRYEGHCVGRHCTERDAATALPPVALASCCGAPAPAPWPPL